MKLVVLCLQRCSSFVTQDGASLAYVLTMIENLQLPGYKNAIDPNVSRCVFSNKVYSVCTLIFIPKYK